MTRVLEQPIAVIEIDDAPGRFRWNSQDYVVSHVAKWWEVDSDWWTEEGRTWRRYYLVTTQCGVLCTLAYDLLVEKWYVVEVYD